MIAVRPILLSCAICIATPAEVAGALPPATERAQGGLSRVVAAPDCPLHDVACLLRRPTTTIRKMPGAEFPYSFGESPFN